MKLRSLALALIALGVGCSSRSGGANLVPDSTLLVRSAPTVQRQARPVAQAATDALYVVSPGGKSGPPDGGWVSEFVPGRAHPLAKIRDADASGFPGAAAFDRSGNLYIANPDENTVSVYAARDKRLMRTLHAGLLHPQSLAFDPAGNLYVANQALLGAHPGSTPLPPGWLTVYHPGETQPSSTMKSPAGFMPYTLTFDRAGNLYVVNAPSDGNVNQDGGSIAIYAPGQRAPHRTISAGIDYPVAIAVDRAGRVYVANINADHSAGNVTVYEPNQIGPSYTIPASSDSNGPIALALDSSDNLYVAYFLQPSTVEVFAPGRAVPSRTLVLQGWEAVSLALDTADNLYVADPFTHGVWIFARSATAPHSFLAGGSPFFITFGPR